MANGGFGAGLSQGVQAGSSFVNMFQQREALGLQKKNTDIRASELALAQRRADLELGTEGKPGLMEREVQAKEGTLKVTQDTDEARWNASLGEKPLRATMTLTGIVGQMSESKPFLQPIIDAVDEGEIKTRGDFRTVMMQKAGTGQFEPMRVKLREKAAKLAEGGDAGKAKELMALYDALGQDKFEDTLDNLMGKPMALRRSAQEKGAGIKSAVTAAGEKFWDERTQSWLQPMSDGTYEKIAQASGKQGRRAVYDANGNLVYEEGGDGLTTKTKGALETGIIDNKEELTRLKGVVGNFNPDFLTIGGKAKGTLLDLKEKLGGEGSLTPDQQKFLDEQSTFFQDTAENINLYIHRLTGAQMSQNEAGRLTLGMPNMGRTWFTGDGPTKFMSKAQNALVKAEAAIRRYEDYKAQGLTDMQIQSLVMSDKAAPLSRYEGDANRPVSELSDEELLRELGER